MILKTDFVDYFDLSGHNTPLQIFFHIAPIENLGISIHIEERNRALKKRPLKNNVLTYSGPLIRNPSLSSPRITRMMLKFEQFLFSDKDDSKNCKNYPHDEYSSYRECDEKFIYKLFKRKYEVMPFWVARSVDEVTNLTNIPSGLSYNGMQYAICSLNSNNQIFLGDFFDGTFVSPCFTPCLTTKV